MRGRGAAWVLALVLLAGCAPAPAAEPRRSRRSGWDPLGGSGDPGGVPPRRGDSVAGRDRGGPHPGEDYAPLPCAVLL